MLILLNNIITSNIKVKKQSFDSGTIYIHFMKVKNVFRMENGKKKKKRK